MVHADRVFAITGSIASAQSGVVGKFRSRRLRADYQRQPLRCVLSRAGCVLPGSPCDVVDREPRRDRNGRGRYPGEGHGVSMEVGLVDVAALCRYPGGAVTRGEAVGSVVETDQLGGALGGEADLGSESGPQTLAAPSDLGRQVLDPHPPLASHVLPPREGNFRVDRPACLVSASERGLCDREPVVP
jgi:hypothetical protein